jgi:hypothetical protein
MEEKEKASLHTLPNEMLFAVYDYISPVLLYTTRFNPERAMPIQNTISLVCRGWRERVMELIDSISFPKTLGPCLLDAMENGGIRIPEVFRGMNIERLNANGIIPFSKGIVDDISNLINLKALSINFSNTVRDDFLSKLTNLDTLKLMSNLQITDKALMPLTDLKSLTLSGQDKITNASLKNLANLERLHLYGVYVVTPSSLSQLTALTVLSLKSGCAYVDQDEKLTDPLSLKQLGIYTQSQITIADLAVLPCLKYLILEGNIVISQQAIDLFGGKIGATFKHEVQHRVNFY